MTWRVAKSIPTLQAQLRPLAPNAPTSSWGTISDAAHSSTSDHSPHDFPGWGSQIVTAGDFPKAERLDPRAVLDAIRRSHDVRVKYGISNGEMFSSYPTSKYAAWTWRPYSGSDLHFGHGHLSVVGDARADGTQPWAITTTSGDDMAALDSADKGWIDTLFRTYALLTMSDKVAQGSGPEANQLAAFLRSWQHDQTAALVGLTTTVNGLRTVVDTLAKAGGGSIDTAAILARIDAGAAEDVNRDRELRDQITALKAELETARRAEIAANRALADALDKPNV